MSVQSEHFKDSELQCHGKICGPDGTGCGVNECTIALVDALESFRAKAEEAWGERTFPIGTVFAPGENKFPGVSVHSAYRCAIHNATMPNAAKSSQHVQGLAADIGVHGMSAAQLEVIARQVPAIKGIGRADIQNYLHIDVRETPAQWCYNVLGGSEKYYPAA